MVNKSKQSLGSYFLSIPGLVVLLIILFLGLYFDAPVLCGFVLLFFLLCFIAYLWSKKVASQLRADMRAVQGVAFPEEDIVLEVSLDNHGSLAAIWAEVYLPIKNQTLLKPENCEYETLKLQNPYWEGSAISQTFAWISRYQKLKCNLELTAKKRGVITIDQIYAKTGDGFGIAATVSANRPDKTCDIYIYPKLYPVWTEKLVLKGSTLQVGRKGTYEDVTMLQNIRAYQNGDSFKKINWRMLAKQQQLQVNLYEKIKPQSIIFLLDLQSFSYEKQLPESADNELMHRVWEEDMELAISFVASTLVALAESGCICGLAIPGYEEVEAEFIYRENNRYFVEEYLKALARISYTGGMSVWPEKQMNLLTSGMGSIYIVTQAAADRRLKIYDFYDNATTIAVHPAEQGRKSNIQNLNDFMDVKEKTEKGAMT